MDQLKLVGQRSDSPTEIFILFKQATSAANVLFLPVINATAVMKQCAARLSLRLHRIEVSRRF